MEWVEQIAGQVVALDTAPLIAFIAPEAPYIDLVRPLFQAVDRGQVRAVTSAVTLIEVLVHPLRENNTALAARYREILTRSTHLATLPVSEEIALKAAELRVTHNLRTPDAIQVATAVVAGAAVFVTNDKRLRLPESLRRIVLDDLLAKWPVE